MPRLNRCWSGRTRRPSASQRSGSPVRSCLLRLLCPHLTVATERARLEQNKETKKKLEDAKHSLEVAQRNGNYERASQLRFQTIPELEAMLPRPRHDSDGVLQNPSNADGSPLPHPLMLHDRVTSGDIARVVAKATGIPVQNLLKGEKEKLIAMEETLKQRVVGQDHVLASVSDAVRISRANLQPPTRPVASFLFLGPTGVGKVCQRWLKWVRRTDTGVADRALQSTCQLFVQRRATRVVSIQRYPVQTCVANVLCKGCYQHERIS